MTSQRPPKTWHAHLADQTLADAILDRILHKAQRIVSARSSGRR
jgi:DNA replication protein DnaC